MTRQIAYHLLLVTFVIAGLTYAVATDHLDSTTLAAWVQAVGSLAAIWGAFMVGSQQSKVAIQAVEHGHHIAATQVRRGIGLLLEATIRQAETCKSNFDAGCPDYGGFVDADLTRPFEGLKKAVDQIPSSESRTSEGVLSLVGLQLAVTDLLTKLKVMGERLKAIDHISPRPTDVAADIQWLCDDIKRHAINLLRELDPHAAAAITGERVSPSA